MYSLLNFDKYLRGPEASGCVEWVNVIPRIINHKNRSGVAKGAKGFSSPIILPVIYKSRYLCRKIHATDGSNHPASVYYKNGLFSSIREGPGAATGVVGSLSGFVSDSCSDSCCGSSKSSFIRSWAMSSKASTRDVICSTIKVDQNWSKVNKDKSSNTDFFGAIDLPPFQMTSPFAQVASQSTNRWYMRYLTPPIDSKWVPRPHIVVQIRGGVSQRQRFAWRVTNYYRVSRTRRRRA